MLDVVVIGAAGLVLAVIVYVGLGWCGSVLMFGLGVALGRRRTLTVYRPEPGESGE